MKQLFTLSFILAASFSQVFGQCPAGETELTMTIVTDRYGDETTWEVTGEGGSPTFSSGGPYTLQTANGAFPQTPVTFCVPDGSILEVTVSDSYGDGMCCTYGEGTWTLSMGATPLASGGSFLYDEMATVALGTDLGISAVAVDDIIAQGNTAIAGSVSNNGINPISSYTLTYSVDGAPGVSQNFTNTIAPGGSYDFSFNTPWAATVGQHDLVITLSDVAGDLIAENNTVNRTIGVATQSVARKTVIEEFTSSTCAPCASLNQTFDPLLNSLNTNQPGSNILAVKYQMNWPSPGNDPSYNADGNTRKNYYGVTGIPDVYMDGGAPMGTTWAGAIANAADKPSFCAVEIEHTVNGTTVDVEVTVTPYSNFIGTHKLYIVATENYYYYPQSTTSQDDFHYAMRKIMPNGNGITLSNMVAGVPQTFTQSHTFTMGNPAQGNFNTWSSALNNITLVAFVQNQNTQNILQGAMSEITTSIAERGEEMNMVVFPNPSNGLLNIGMELTAPSALNIVLTNVVGEVVLQQKNTLGTGEQTIILDLNGLANGSYYLTVQGDEMITTRKITLTR